MTAALRGSRVAVVGGAGEHRAIAWPVVERIRDTLAALGYRADVVDAERDDFADQVRPYDLAYLAHFGIRGDDGTVQGLLASLNIPYTGSGIKATALAQDKVLAKTLFRAGSLRTPDFREIDLSGDVRAQADSALRQLGGRVVIKPVFGGGSYGMSLADTVEDICVGVAVAAAFGRVFLEAFVPGRTLTAGVVGVGESTVVLPAHEVRFVDDKPFLHSATLFQAGMSETVIPPRATLETVREVEDAARRAHDILDARGLSRSDFKVDAHDQVWILELNTLPAMSPISDLPIAAARAGLEFSELIERILLTAVDRPWYVP